MTAPPHLSGPGIILSASRITDTQLLSDALFNEWYNTVHVRDVLAAGGVPTATRFKDANSAAASPYLAIYNVPDLSVCNSEKFKKIPMTSEILPQGKTIHELAFFDTRYYQLVQEYPDEGEEKPEGWHTALLLAGVEPATGKDKDYDAYMRQEHLQQMALEPGWRRTKRYKLLHQVRPTKNPASWLALYEFDGKNKLGTTVKPLEPMTEWTKSMFSDAKGMELGIFHKTGEQNP